MSCIELVKLLDGTIDSWKNWAYAHPIIAGKMWPGVCPNCQPKEHEDYHKQYSELVKKNPNFSYDSCRCTIC